MGEAIKPDWSGIVKRFEASGLSQREFAKREGVACTTLHYYLYKLRRAATAAPVGRLVPVVPMNSPIMVTVRRGKIYVDLPPTVRPEYVAALVRAIEAPRQATQKHAC